MKDSERAATIVLEELTPMLALLATRGLYEEQPALWTLGENGRARTLEDFSHHFRALQGLSVPAFRAHLQYCEDLFAARGFPHRWLEDAWRWMAVVIEREVPPPIAEQALGVLRAGVGDGVPAEG
jgi:hypothetical protein